MVVKPRRILVVLNIPLCSDPVDADPVLLICIQFVLEWVFPVDNLVDFIFGLALLVDQFADFDQRRLVHGDWVLEQPDFDPVASELRHKLLFFLPQHLRQVVSVKFIEILFIDTHEQLVLLIFDRIKSFFVLVHGG